MLDPLSTISFTSNIVQFLDFAGEVVSGARELYNSEKGTTEANQELEDLAKAIQDHARKIKSNEISIVENGASYQLETLLRLSQQCEKVALELLEVLGTLKLKDDRRGWNSVKRALLTVWKQSEIDKLQIRLDRINNELHNQVSLSNQQEVHKLLRDLISKNEKLSASLEKELKSLRKCFDATFERLSREHQMDRETTAAWSQLILASQLGIDYSVEQYILNNLYFHSMFYRQESISKEHSQTFRWIFEKDNVKSNPSWHNVNFAQWLVTEDCSNLYWVSGKPGSGKSTLMKYLADEPKVTKLLKQWAGNDKLAVANFYFWSAGDDLQKSALGLLRSILFQILRECPDLIKHAFPREWNNRNSENLLLPLSFSNHFKKVVYLRAALRRIMPLLSKQGVKLCFYIDGLDEYEGDPADIISIVDLLHEGSNVKACVSSRSWNEFEASFGAENPWKLYIHELTREDIRLYTEDKLGKDKRFKQMQAAEQNCPDLVNSIVEGAQGVFLWVVLVIHSLQEGMTHGDGIRDLQRRLDEIPTDLEEYFKIILDSVDKRYRKQTAHTFRLLLEVEGTHSLMGCWFVEESDLNSVLKMPVSTVPDSTKQYRIEQMKKRINARGMGLLQVYQQGDGPYAEKLDTLNFPAVGFLHRTVRDFFMMVDMRKLLDCWSSSSFNANLEVCQASLAVLKTCPSQKPEFTKQGPAYRLVCRFFSSAEWLTQIGQLEEVLLALTNELTATLAKHRKRGAKVPRIFNPIAIHESLENSSDFALITMAIGAGHFGFVRHKLNDMDLSIFKRPETLVFSLFAENNRKGRTEIVQFLLGKGLDPSRAVIEVLRSADGYYVNRFKDSTIITEFYDTIKLLLKKGANIDGIEFETGFRGIRSARSILEKALTGEQLKALNILESEKGSINTGWVRKKVEGRNVIDQEKVKEVKEVYVENRRPKAKVHDKLKSRIRKFVFLKQN
jgi:hypothetical protein